MNTNLLKRDGYCYGIDGIKDYTFFLLFEVYDFKVIFKLQLTTQQGRMTRDTGTGILRTIDHIIYYLVYNTRLSANLATKDIIIFANICQ